MSRFDYMTPQRIFRNLRTKELQLTNEGVDPMAVAYSKGKLVTDKVDLAMLNELGVKDAGQSPENKEASRRKTKSVGSANRPQAPSATDLEREAGGDPAKLLVIGRSKVDLLALAREEDIDTSKLKGNASKETVAQFIVAARFLAAGPQTNGGSDSETT